MSGSGNRHDVVSLREHPGQRELRGRTVVLGSDLLDLRDQLEVLLEIRCLKTWVLSPEIVLGQVVNTLDLAGQKSATEGAVGYEADVEETQRIEQAGLGI